MRIPRRSFLSLLASAAAANSLPRHARALPFAATTPASDPLRPEFHLMPQHNWMNDPNGPIFWKGSYHLFYQLNPHAAVWGDMHWGHAISTDMIHWRHEPIALAPTPGGPDSEGCFSGSAVVFNGTPTFIYTGVQNADPPNVTLHDASNKLRETQMLATAEDDNLLRWKKLPQPVIAAPPPGMNVTGFRDPCPWQESDAWYLAVGSGQRGKGGSALLYRSQDLRHWEYLHPLAQGQPTGSTAADPVDSGDMWECPDFFELNGRHCLLYSTERKVYWTTGDYDRRTHRYTPTRTGILDFGAYYAPKSFLAPDDRRILWGWIPETRPQSVYAAAGWAGCMSLPRVLGVNADGQLTIAIASEAQSLREAAVHATVRNNTVRHALPTLRQELELRASAQTSAVSVRLRTQDSTIWELKLDFAAKSIQCGDRSFALAALAAGQPTLGLHLDASVIESLIGGTQAITSRVYKVQPGQTLIEIEAQGEGACTVTRWPLKTISPDRLTT